MKVYLNFAVLVMFVAACASGGRPVDPGSWTDTEIHEWFGKKEWLGSTALQPDSSIDRREFAVLFHGNKERWHQAFFFLKDRDLSAMEAGRYEVDGNKVFVLVSEYESKDSEDVMFESHKLYADIHYVVSGTEYIGLGDLSGATVKIPYDKERDIMFHRVKESENLLASPGTFFIFPPGTIHGPGGKVHEATPVEKIVIKVKS